MVHVMFICPFTVQAWSMARLAQEIAVAVQTKDTEADIVFQLLSMLFVEHKQRLAAVFCSI